MSKHGHLRESGRRCGDGYALQTPIKAREVEKRGAGATDVEKLIAALVLPSPAIEGPIEGH